MICFGFPSAVYYQRQELLKYLSEIAKMKENFVRVVIVQRNGAYGNTGVNFDSQPGFQVVCLKWMFGC